MARVPKNLSLEPEAIARGERYGERHGKNLSQLVNDLLHALPLERSAGAELSPLVRRLLGVAAGADADRESHRDHLSRKYGAT
ncbi:MAG: hypothetical protein H0X69_10510 [Gemmatimonadales bacterium]|nr:hypothetical protein [Gemmatimonadales bacterium]